MGMRSGNAMRKNFLIDQSKLSSNVSIPTIKDTCQNEFKSEK